MRTANRCSMVLAAVFLLAGGSSGQAVEPATTAITVPGIDCAGCARRVEAQLVKVRGVARVQSNVKAKIFFVTPQANTVLSPRALWEAVENARERPSRLEGPSGTFTSKPPF